VTFCGRCGNHLEDNDPGDLERAFCGRCGNSLEDNSLDGLEEVPDHRNDLGDWCPRSGERTADGTCPLYCHEADVLTGFDAGDRELPADTDLPRELWPPYMLRSEEEGESR